MYDYEALVMDVIDGDTVRLMVDLGFKVTITENFRLARINAPEKNTPEGKAAKAWLEERLPTLTTVHIRSDKAPKQEKYGRWLATIWDDGSQLPINDDIIAAGHAVEWDGKGKRPT